LFGIKGFAFVKKYSLKKLKMKKNDELQIEVQDTMEHESLLSNNENTAMTKVDVATTAVVTTEAEKNEIKDGNICSKNDNEILNDILSYFKWTWRDSSDKLKAFVKDGWVTLEGWLQWNFLKEITEKSIRNIKGVKGVTNHISIKP